MTIDLRGKLVFLLIFPAHVMLPLRFFNSGIRAKTVRWRGGQPPCRVDHPRPGRNEGPLEGGGRLRPGPARKGGRRRSQGQQLVMEASAACGGNSPQGQQLPASTPACRVAPAMGANCRAPTRACPHGQPCSQQGVANPWQGGCRRARATVACAWATATTVAAQMGQEGLGHPFEKRMILPF
ncbi:hypothetical protein GW17_00011945 [Ensete ventricosum]|nr:hypothetical protein GW17_00011945 [Ensete ventricosum]